MNKKIIAFSLAFVVLCAVFAGCKKKAAEPVSIIVTDDSGKAVTDKNGAVVTKIAIPLTDKNGNAVTEKATNSKGQVLTEKDGKEKMVVVTESGTTTTKKQANTVISPDKVPYSTTAPEANKYIDEWTFGAVARVGCNAPSGWTNETVNQLLKNGTNTRVVISPVNYLGSSLKTAEEYAQYFRSVNKDKYTQLSYQKEVYSNGMGIAMLEKAKKDFTDAQGHKFGKYSMTYIFQTGDKIRTYFVTADSEKEARVSLKDIIANTYYRG